MCKLFFVIAFALVAIACATEPEKKDLQADESVFLSVGLTGARSYAYPRYYSSYPRYVGTPDYYRYGSPYAYRYGYEPYGSYYRSGLDRVVYV